MRKETKAMQKRFRAIPFCMILLMILSSAALALGEKNYVSIQEIRDNLPERWTGEYVVKNGAPKQLKNGATVSVDVPIVVPEVDNVPVVRITWDPPAEDLDESLKVDRNDWVSKVIGRDFPMDEMSFPVMENNVTFEPTLPWEEAPDIAIDEFQKWMPFMKDKELTPYFLHSYGDSEGNGFQCVWFYTTYHGIPHLIGSDYFWNTVKSEYGKVDGPAVPLTLVAMRIKRPGQFWANIHSSKEVGVDIADIPLLPFGEIVKVLEQRVTDGYVYSLNEVRFGYMGFIDPDKKGEEFVLLPVWAAKGRTRGSLKQPFALKDDQVVVDRIGYSNKNVIVINAQTGEVYDFANDVRPDRRYVPHIITWDEVK